MALQDCPRSFGLWNIGKILRCYSYVCPKCRTRPKKKSLLFTLLLVFALRLLCCLGGSARSNLQGTTHCHHSLIKSHGPRSYKAAKLVNQGRAHRETRTENARQDSEVPSMRSCAHRSPQGNGHPNPPQARYFQIARHCEEDSYSTERGLSKSPCSSSLSTVMIIEELEASVRRPRAPAGKS